MHSVLYATERGVGLNHGSVHIWYISKAILHIGNLVPPGRCSDVYQYILWSIADAAYLTGAVSTVVKSQGSPGLLMSRKTILLLRLRDHNYDR